MRVSRLIACLAIVLLAPLPGLAMDGVRVETRADRAVAAFGATGRGVLVAVLDRGIDWLNNDFRNDDGTTRIAYIFDMLDDRGAHAPGNPYGIGTIYTREQIDAALAGGPPLATRDALGHGTTTTGIIAGNGRNLPDRKYHGIAPEATIVSVKITGGAPAHDDQPAEADFYIGNGKIPVVIDFVRDKARELGMPCVMLLNVGTQQGPTDGTSQLSRAIDAAVGPGIPGLVFVTGPGDDGGSPNRVGGTVVEGDTAAIQIEKGAGGFLRFDMWYSELDRFDVSVQTPAGLRGPYPSPGTAADAVDRAEPEFVAYHRGADVEFFGATSAKRELLIDFSGPPGLYTVNLIGRTVANGRFDGILNPSPFDGANRFLSYVAPGSIWDGASARNNICPGDYVFRTDWVDVDNVPRSLRGQGAPGEIWRGSSTGPTFDGRLGIDVCAPGDSLFTTYNPKSYFAAFRSNLIEGGGGLYGRASAVSAAAPIVTGVVALMLELNPDLDASEVKSILQRTARSDGFTGTTPNPMWGYGKVDAFGALAAADPGSGADASTDAEAGTPDASGAGGMAGGDAGAAASGGAGGADASTDAEAGTPDASGAGGTAGGDAGAAASGGAGGADASTDAEAGTPDASGAGGTAGDAGAAGAGGGLGTAGRAGQAGSGGTGAAAGGGGRGGTGGRPDAGKGGSSHDPGNEGCDCRSAGGSGSRANPLLLVLAALAVRWRRSKRRSAIVARS